MAVVGNILAALAVAILRWWAERQSLQDAERAKLALAAAAAARRALTYKAAHPVAPGPDPVGDFRVRPDADRLAVPPRDPGAPDPERRP